jgi:hypothetical protein
MTLANSDTFKQKIHDQSTLEPIVGHCEDHSIPRYGQWSWPGWIVLWINIFCMFILPGLLDCTENQVIVGFLLGTLLLMFVVIPITSPYMDGQVVRRVRTWTWIRSFAPLPPRVHE